VKVSLMFLLFIVAMPNISIGCDVNDERVKEWAARLQSDKNTPLDDNQIKYACKLIFDIDDHIMQAQNAISQIASDRVSYRDKIGNSGLIEKTIQSFFLNGGIPVEVFHSYSDKRQPPDEIRIRTYLQRLVDLTSKGIYSMVRLMYDQEEMKLIDIFQLDSKGDAFQIEIQAFQEFRVCKTNDGRNCYVDIVKRRFIVRVTDKNSDEPKLKILRITALDTWPPDYFYKNRNSLMGRE